MCGCIDFCQCICTPAFCVDNVLAYGTALTISKNLVTSTATASSCSENSYQEAWFKAYEIAKQDAEISAHNDANIIDQTLIIVDEKYKVRTDTNSPFNTSLGDKCSFLPNVANSTAIGYNVSVKDSNTIQLGNTLTVNVLTNKICNITAKSFSTSSDKRDKCHFRELDAGLDFLTQLIPLRYDWDSRDGLFKLKDDIGFIAQDLISIQEKTNILIPDLVNKSDEKNYTVAYTKLIPVLVKSIQELKVEMDKKIVSIKKENFQHYYLINNICIIYFIINLYIYIFNNIFFVPL